MIDDEERQHLEGLLQEHRRRLRPLEIRKARSGHATPPEVLNEIKDILTEIARIEAQLRPARADPSPVPTVPPPDPAALERLWRQALSAFFTKNWPRAGALLAEVAAIDPHYRDVQAKLGEVQRQRDLLDLYNQACELRGEDDWQAVFGALDELERRQPGYPDPQGLRAWAEGRQQREQHYDAALAACERSDWPAAAAELEALLAASPDDAEAQALLEHAHAEQEQIERWRRAAAEHAYRERFGPTLELVQAGDFAAALDLLEALLRERPGDREAALLAAGLIENAQVPLMQRIRAARLADAVGDPRPGLQLEHPDYWAKRIEPGPFLMGDDDGRWDDEKPAFVCRISRPYALARYPVTNSQYTRFLADLRRQGKSKEAQRRRPRGWQGETFAAGKGNHPVAGVTWEDATAFAAWADATLRAAGVLGPGEAVRLLAEPEWERAAAYPVMRPGGDPGAGRREYPWGGPHPPGPPHAGGAGTFPANTAESGIHDTSAASSRRARRTAAHSISPATSGSGAARRFNGIRCRPICPRKHLTLLTTGEPTCCAAARGTAIVASPVAPSATPTALTTTTVPAASVSPVCSPFRSLYVFLPS